MTPLGTLPMIRIIRTVRLTADRPPLFIVIWGLMVEEHISATVAFPIGLN